MKFRKQESIWKQIYVDNKCIASAEVRCSYYLDESMEIVYHNDSMIPDFNHCLYIHVPKNHWMFKAMKSENNYWKYNTGFDWHGGVTFCEFKRGAKGIYGKKIGCDFQHLYDEDLGREKFPTYVMLEFKRLIKFIEGRDVGNEDQD